MSLWTLEEPPTQDGTKSVELTRFNSMVLLIGSAAPKILLYCSILKSCCVSSQFWRRASRGCLLLICELMLRGPVLVLRISWIPSAEGADSPNFTESTVLLNLLSGTILRLCGRLLVLC
ncbi:hypothetical protein WICPIJ_007372 [Wickerhamomyces pijperi]|uniref:Uncharacterized protein n=1 Tax=Wickerhamomyces pijperi TaxID=599730 RepID=A0A9P8TJZ1_WICPI|nr:hypothetical protein WICPIJ_007372 [Wickerhamomyces pijperi]